MIDNTLLEKYDYFDLKTINSVNSKEDIDSERKEFHFFRHLFHKKVISRLFYALCSKKIRIAIFNFLKKLGFEPIKMYNFIDISCGYDNLLIDLAKIYNNSIIVGNDLCWKRLLSISKKNQLNNLILKTQDILKPDFLASETYDLIICKNTLHHIPRQKHLNLLKRLVQAGNIVLIIEIEDPINSSVHSFFWNFYYRKFLKDDGKYFLNKKSFLELLIKLNPYCLEIKFGTIKTLKGNYFLSFIRRKVSWKSNKKIFK